jgi:hypothetical protein
VNVTEFDTNIGFADAGGIAHAMAGVACVTVSVTVAVAPA